MKENLSRYGPATSYVIESIRASLNAAQKIVSRSYRDRLYIYPFLTGITLVLGALREMLIAKHYGLGSELDAFAAASCLYLFLGTQVGNGLETTFITRYANHDAIELRRRLFCSQLGISIILAFVFFGLFFSSNVFFNIFFGFEIKQTQLASHIVFAYLPAILFSALISLPRAVLYIKGHYAWGFSYGAIISASVMATISVSQSSLGIFSLPLGYGIGNFIILTIVIKQSLHSTRHKPLKLDTLLPLKTIIHSLKIWKLAAPVLIVEMLFQGSYITERAFAAQNGDGSLSAYFYAVSILMIFSALVIQPVSIILFPKVARAYKADHDAAKRYVLKICAIMFTIGLMATTLIYFLSATFVDIWLVRGKFTTEDGIKTAAILKVLVFAIPFMSIAKILKSSLYSGGSYYLPIVTNALRWALLALLAASLTPIAGITGLAIASVFGTALDCLIMFIFFYKKQQSCASK